MARTFDQVYAELGSAYDPSAQLYQQQIDAIPQSTDAAIAQADAKLGQANESILSSARQRGMGYSGMPMAEQAKYAATEYAPAIANLKSNAMSQKTSLLEAVNSLNRDRKTQAQSIFENEAARELAQRQFEESIRQFNEQLAYNKAKDAADRASSASNAQQYLDMLSGANNTQTASSKPSVASNGKGGFTFIDGGGNAITAGQYAAQTNQDIRDVLYSIGSQGDNTAAQLYNMLRPIKDVNALDKTLRQLAPKYSYILNGYVTGGGRSPINA